MYILRSMFVMSGSSLYPGFVIVRFDCVTWRIVMIHCTVCDIYLLCIFLSYVAACMEVMCFKESYSCLGNQRYIACTLCTHILCDKCTV